jgi:hypothetical protein
MLYYGIMKKSTTSSHGGKRAGAGRPATGQDRVRAVRLSDELMAMVDAWAEAHGIARSEAMRRLLELGMKAKAK